MRGPLVTPGYYNKPEETEEARTFGWHHTGDIGYLDDENYLYIVDRKKDMIITGGFNVFATEVEGPILELNEVLECAVVGLPDEKWGEAVTAVVRLKKGSKINGNEILQAIKPKLGSYKTQNIFSFGLPFLKLQLGRLIKS